MIGKEFDITRRRVLFTVVVIGLASAAAGAGTMAYFSDTETSANNNVTAGTLDLGGVSDAQITATNAVPGDTVSGTVTSTYTGSVDAEIDIAIALTEPSETASNPTNLSATQFADNLNVATATVNVGTASENLVTSGMDTNTDGNVNLTEFQADSPFDAVTGTNATNNDQVTFTLELEFLPGTGNDAQADGVNVEVAITAEQPEADV